MSPVQAVLFDRDGTLVHDVPYNGDPERVRPVDGAREAVALLRAHGVRVGVVTNQSGVARGLISETDVRHVNRRIDDLVGPFDVWAICPHGPDDGCRCRKPQPGLVLHAADRLGATPADCVVIGDIGADTEAAARAGAHGILVPNTRTRPEETAAAPHVAPDLLTAVRALLDAAPPVRTPADAGSGAPAGAGASRRRPVADTRRRTR
ncbi:D-glycero-alpha-D-manno-heptose-1,7-bisphosphate 7-phosphatase [Streptomyces sp. NPDC016675]|uniref:D-glycero-alpha-D-manno-heptose-1,7-bisphosphate 7-phosphatase n=1 Tax=Streptomyces sp. NPDC016675 TaxID=3364970 RepID=UPI0037025460